MTALENPYFDEVSGAVTIGSYRFDYTDNRIEALRRRNDLVQEYAWAIPNIDVIETIVSFDPVLEVGTGNGY